jgi:hypothetical protein
MLGASLVGGLSMNNKKRSLLAAVLLASALVTTPAFTQAKQEDAAMPKVGDVAPDFTLKVFEDGNLKDVKLSDYRGKKNVVLAFYVFAFTGG